MERHFDSHEILEVAGLAIVIGLALYLSYSGDFVVSSSFLPTYDNSMLHAARARVVMDSQHWAETEVVFGGVSKSYHLPFGPSVFAALSEFGSLDLWWTIRLFNVFTTVLLALAFYCLVRSLTKDWRAACVAAVFALSSTNLMSWGTRTTPISIGVVMVIFGLYAVHKRWLLAAVLSGLSVALDHQPSLLALAISLAVFAIAGFFCELLGRRKALESVWIAIDRHSEAIATGALAFLAYFAWHLRQTGLACLNFKCLPQAANKEFGKSIDLAGYFTGTVQHAFAAAGIFLLFASRRIPKRDRLLAAAFFAATLILVKNDLLGIGVFTERFLTYFDEANAILAGIAVAEILLAIEEPAESFIATILHYGKRRSPQRGLP
ncbi:hypothetical protein HY995_00690 [Candidatus Micrarchaeota archaeon]|nr:hypothetical protein [Candidatus Micrarchaeota archaeon]MBI5176584.1 hypothetical protein [Candidatus Micrarchaeota archaeon]